MRLSDARAFVSCVGPIAHWDGYCINQAVPSWRADLGGYLEPRVRTMSDMTVVAAREGEGADVLEQVAAHYARVELGWRTIEERGAEQGRNALRTLRRAPPWASTIGEPWLGLHAFVVAAGPSLDKNLYLLPEAKKRGPVVAVNTSVRACLSVGVQPDVVLCLEAHDLRGHFEGLDPRVPVVLDMRASEANWSAHPRAWAIANHDPSLSRIQAMLGVPPVPYEGSCACAAVSLAIRWGAATVVLMGQDLSYPGGRCYSETTPFGDVRCEVMDGVLHYVGTSKQPHPEPAHMVPAWGGGQVPTTHGMATFLHWFGQVAMKHEIINATEGGARIDGSYEHWLEDVLAVLPERDLPELPEPAPRDTSTVLRELAWEARRLLRDRRAVQPSYRGALLNHWVAGLIARSKWQHVPESEIRAALERGCRDVMEILS